MLRSSAASALCVLLAGCASSASREARSGMGLALAPGAPQPIPVNATAGAVSATGSGRQPGARVSAVEVRRSPAEIARAKALVVKGVELYRDGEYTQAEESLKQAIEIYPFMAQANVVMAKILLIRASATKDMTLYANARLMLEMARALDPSSREIAELLELIRQPTTE
jgi:tetratricopeptide (TPR) repeat protein